jgi:hypothetical protein
VRRRTDARRQHLAGGGRDPEDSNIRLAPSFPPMSELEMALEVLCLCIRLAGVKRLLVTDS